MTIEKRIEEALMRHADDVKAEPGAWNQIESRVRRGYRIRIAVASVAAAAAAATAVIVVPKIVGSNDRTGPPAAGDATPTPTQTATEQGSGVIPQGWSGALNIAHGFWFAVPSDWKSGMFEGHYEYRPPNLPGLTLGENTFAFESYMLDESQVFGRSSTDTEVGGREAKRWEVSEQGGAHTVTYDISWDCWSGPGVVVDCETPRLIVRLYASTPELWEEHGATGERMVAFMSHASGPAPTGDIRTAHGVVKANVRTYDDRTWALIRLFEATILADNDTVDSILSSDAKRQLQRAEGGVRYYEPGGDYVLLSYEITSRADADANSSNFTVLLDDSKVPDGPRQQHAATWGVGAGTNVKGRRQTAVVRFVEPNSN